MLSSLRQVPAKPASLAGTNGQGNAAAALLLAVWGTGDSGVFFSFSTRQEYYVLPSLPASGAALRIVG